MWRIALITGCIAIAGYGVVQASVGSEPTFPANQRAARAFAQHELSGVRLPAGAAETTADPAVGGVLDKPQSVPGFGHRIDRYRFWRVPGTAAALIGWLRRDRPAGTRLAWSGSGAKHGVAYVWVRGYSYRTHPGAVYEAELDFAIAAAKRAGTAVRVDSFAAGLVPRPAWERVPATVTSVAISARSYDGRRSYPVAAVTDPTLVQRLVATFNGFQIVQPGTVSLGCGPVIGAAPQLRFRFLSDTGAELAGATELPCVGLNFAVGNRSGPALQPDVDLTQLLWSDHVLAVCSALAVKGEPVARTPAPVEFSVAFQIHDADARACGLRGYPRVRLRSATGGSLIPHVTRIPAGHPVTPPVVLLDPSWPATTSISWPARPECKSLPFNRVQFQLPGVASPFNVRLRHPIAPCGDRIILAPIG